MQTQNRPWLALITYCTLAGAVAAFALALLFASATLAFAVAQSARSESRNPVNAVSSRTRTFSGMITDSHCGAKHRMSDKSPAECARACLRNGAQYRLVDGDKVYALHGNEQELARRAGQRATVAGTLDGNAIRVSAVNN